MDILNGPQLAFNNSLWGLYRTFPGDGSGHNCIDTDKLVARAMKFKRQYTQFRGRHIHRQFVDTTSASFRSYSITRKIILQYQYHLKRLLSWGSNMTSPKSILRASARFSIAKKFFSYQTTSLRHKSGSLCRILQENSSCRILDKQHGQSLANSIKLSLRPHITQ
jgi:hypothetical protein